MPPRPHPYRRPVGPTGRRCRCTASACVVYVDGRAAEEEPDLQVLLIWKQHSPAFRGFFDDLAAGRGSAAADRLPLLQKDELERVAVVGDPGPDGGLDALFRDVFGRNPSFPSVLRRWQAGDPLAVFRSLGIPEKCQGLLTSRKDADFPLYWEFPGGDVDRTADGAEAEAAPAAAVREAFEETGYVVAAAPEYGLDEANRWGPEQSNVNHLVVCRLPPGRRPADGPAGRADPVEVRAVRWVPVGAAFHMLRDPRNHDYPNFLRKVQCHFLHAEFQRRLALRPMPAAVPAVLDRLRHTMETNLLVDSQRAELAAMAEAYNQRKAQGAPPAEREAAKQAMLRMVLAAVQSNASRPSAEVYV